MQLSPRQYQADPTGAAYVQDTRPLMAAMGAQAATQIEGNRMMTETMQKGMQGIENFAARRQLAAARAQLGTLDTNAEDYGQKLAGLVLDNPLAFTNAKTAPIANMAFKQASDENQARLARKYQLADMATKFGYEKDLITLRGQTDAKYRAPSRYASDPYAVARRQAANNIFQSQMAELKAKEKDLMTEFNETDEGGKISVQADLDAVNQRQQQLIQDYYNQSGAQAAVQPVFSPDGEVDMTGFQAPLTPDSSVGDGSFATGGGGQNPLPIEGVPPDNYVVSGDLTDQQNLDASLFPNASIDQTAQTMAPVSGARPLIMEPMPSPEVIPEGRAVPATPASAQALNQLSIENPIGGLLAPEAPTIEDLTAQPLQDTAKNIAEAKSIADAKKIEAQKIALADSKISRSESAKFRSLSPESQRELVKSNIRLHPEVIGTSVELEKASIEQASAKRLYDAAKQEEDAAKIAEANTALVEADNKVAAAKLKAEIASSAAYVSIFDTGNPFKWNRDRTAALQREQEIKMREDQAKAAADAKAAAANLKKTKTEDAAAAFNKASLEGMIALKSQEPLRIAEETNKQWTGAKNEISTIVGGQPKLDKIVFDSIQNPVFGSSIMSSLSNSLGRKSWVARIKNDILESMPVEQRRKMSKGKAFDQKAERDGPQEVYWDSVLTVLADEMLTKYEAAYSNVMNPTPSTAAPAAFKPSSGATGNTKP